MFGKSRGHGKHKKETNKKKYHIRNWTQSQKQSEKKRKNEANLFAVIMSSSDPTSPAQASISTTSFDVLDDARLDKIGIDPVKTQPTKSADSPNVDADADAIEEAVPIMKTTLPVPCELKPKLEKNGIEVKTKKSSEPNDDCLINCIYFTQQCCECTIV